MAQEKKGLTIRRIAAACGGSYTGPEELLGRQVTGVVLDSRKVEAGNLFLATKGERTDGHAFLGSAREKGALCCLGEEPPAEDGAPYIQVGDSFQALKEIAAFYREELHPTVVGVTGSVGKTSTKELIASVLAEKYRVLKTEGNFNNEVGLPLTVLRLTQDEEAAVLEMGISDFGEMRRLSRIAKPDICVITNIGQCHLENLKSREGILRAKTEMFECMNRDGVAVLNGDDDMLCKVQTVQGKPPLRYGLGRGCDVWADHLERDGLLGTRFLLHTPEGERSMKVPLPGDHMVYNALAAALVGQRMGLSLEQIEAGVENVKALGGRSRIARLGARTLIDDCYNANPVSMRAALDLLCMAQGHKTAILGDMFELGKDEAALHAQIGAYAAAKPIDCLIFAGELAREMYESAKSEADRQNASEKRILYYPGRDAMLDDLPNVLHEKTTVLVKASHGMGFDEVVRRLEGDAAQP